MQRVVPQEVRDAIVDLLATVYRRVDWRKVARGRDPLDIFQHRVLAAAYQPTVRRFIEKLCRGLGIQGLRINPETLKVLEENEEVVMDELRTSSVYYVALAYAKVKAEKGGR